MEGEYGFDEGDADFLTALSRRNWTSVCSLDQVQGTYDLLVDGFLDRLDRQSGFFSRTNWIGRFNSYGYILPLIESLWTEWWRLDSQGKAIAALEYVWGLAWPNSEGELPGLGHPFDGSMYFEADGSIYGRGWEAANIEFLASILNFDYLVRKVTEAIAILTDESDRSIGKEILSTVLQNQDLVINRIQEIPYGLAEPVELRWTNVHGWIGIPDKFA